MSSTNFQTINFAKGDRLVTTFPIAKEDSSEILFEAGTEVVIKSIKKGQIHLELPNGDVQIFDGNQLPFFFKNITSGESFSITHQGNGTPPKGLYPFLPKGATWKKNYVWKVHITLEERGEKEIICPECTSELSLDAEKNKAGKYFCKPCKDFVVAFNSKTGKPFVDLESAQEIVEKTLD